MVHGAKNSRGARALLPPTSRAYADKSYEKFMVYKIVKYFTTRNILFFFNKKYTKAYQQKI